MKRLSYLFMLIIFLGSWGNGAFASLTPHSPVPAPSPTSAASVVSSVSVSRFDSADQLFKARKDPKKAQEALKLYRTLYEVNPADPQVGWRLSMACYFVGNRMDKDASEEREKIFIEGRDVGKKAVEKDPNCAPCHFWTAINMALYGQANGVFKTLSTLDEIKRHAQETVRIDPKYAYGGAYRLLGQIEAALPGILGGSNKRAKEHFQKAMEVSPDEPMNYVLLAKMLDEEDDDRQEALKLAEKGAALKIDDSSRVESIEAIQDLRKLLADWSKK